MDALGAGPAAPCGTLLYRCAGWIGLDLDAEPGEMTPLNVRLDPLHEAMHRECQNRVERHGQLLSMMGSVRIARILAKRSTKAADELLEVAGGIPEEYQKPDRKQANGQPCDNRKQCMECLRHFAIQRTQKLLVVMARPEPCGEGLERPLKRDRGRSGR